MLCPPVLLYPHGPGDEQAQRVWREALRHQPDRWGPHCRVAPSGSRAREQRSPCVGDTPVPWSPALTAPTYGTRPTLTLPFHLGVLPILSAFRLPCTAMLPNPRLDPHGGVGRHVAGQLRASHHSPPESFLPQGPQNQNNWISVSAAMEIR